MLKCLVSSVSLLLASFVAHGSLMLSIDANTGNMGLAELKGISFFVKSPERAGGPV